jgi:aconitate hydratase
VSELATRAAKEGWPMDISSCLIGSCTNSSYEDMAKCANLSKQALDAGLKYKIPFFVTPGSRAVQVRCGVNKLPSTLSFLHFVFPRIC